MKIRFYFRWRQGHPLFAVETVYHTAWFCTQPLMTACCNQFRAMRFHCH